MDSDAIRDDMMAKAKEEEMTCMDKVNGIDIIPSNRRKLTNETNDNVPPISNSNNKSRCEPSRDINMSPNEQDNSTGEIEPSNNSNHLEIQHESMLKSSDEEKETETAFISTNSESIDCAAAKDPVIATDEVNFIDSDDDLEMSDSIIPHPEKDEANNDNHAQHQGANISSDNNEDNCPQNESIADSDAIRRDTIMKQKKKEIAAIPTNDSDDGGEKDDESKIKGKINKDKEVIDISDDDDDNDCDIEDSLDSCLQRKTKGGGDCKIRKEWVMINVLIKMNRKCGGSDNACYRDQTNHVRTPNQLLVDLKNVSVKVNSCNVNSHGDAVPVELKLYGTNDANYKDSANWH